MPANKLIIIDTHSHIQFPAYGDLSAGVPTQAGDREAVIARASEAGVAMLAIGTQVSTSEAGIKLTREFPEDVLGATAGFHPSHLNTDWHHDPDELDSEIQEKFDIQELRRVASEKEVVGIGECGLDYYRLTGDQKQLTIDRQKEVFISQIELAHELKKPLVIHCRSAFADLIDLLTTSAKGGSASGGNRLSLNALPGIIHFFSGTKDDAEKLLNLGFYLAFGGVVTFARDYDEALRFTPLDRILLETDAPYVAPASHRGKKNEPAYITETAKKIAELKPASYEKVCEITSANARRVFRL